MWVYVIFDATEQIKYCTKFKNTSTFQVDFDGNVLKSCLHIRLTVVSIDCDTK